MWNLVMPTWWVCGRARLWQQCPGLLSLTGASASRKIYQSNKTMKIKVSQFLVQHLPFCITLLNFLTEFTAQWKMSLPLTRLELSTAQFFTMSTFHCKKTVVWIVGLMKINVKIVSDFKEFRISSTVFVQCPKPWRTDWLLAETSKCCSNNE